MATPSGRRGTAILLALLLAVLLTSVTAGLALRASAERRTASDDAAALTAASAARSAMARFLASPTHPSDSVAADTVFLLGADSASVEARRIQRATEGDLWVVVARGGTLRHRLGAGTPAARVALAQLVRRAPVAAFAIPGALTSLGGIRLDGTDMGGGSNGSNGQGGAPGAREPVSGVDLCGSGAVIPGAATTTGGFRGDSTRILGQPAGAPVAIGTAGPTGTAAATIGLDWSAVTSRTLLPPDPGFDFGTSPDPAAWNARFPAAPGSLPISRISGSAILRGNTLDAAHGLLVVTGNLELRDGFTFRGILLVGGSFRLRGGASVQGAVLTGLDRSANGLSNEARVESDGRIQYDRCMADSLQVRTAGAVVWRPLRDGRTGTHPLF